MIRNGRRRRSTNEEIKTYYVIFPSALFRKSLLYKTDSSLMWVRKSSAKGTLVFFFWLFLVFLRTTLVWLCSGVLRKCCHFFVYALVFSPTLTTKRKSIAVGKEMTYSATLLPALALSKHKVSNSSANNALCEICSLKSIVGRNQ